MGLLLGDLCPSCWDVILLYPRLDRSLALAIRTTELCQTGASQPEWARTRVASLGFELMVATRLLPLIVALLVPSGLLQVESISGSLINGSFVRVLVEK